MIKEGSTARVRQGLCDVAANGQLVLFAVKATAWFLKASRACGATRRRKPAPSNSPARSARPRGSPTAKASTGEGWQCAVSRPLTRRGSSPRPPTGNRQDQRATRYAFPKRGRSASRRCSPVKFGAQAASTSSAPTVNKTEAPASAAGTGRGDRLPPHPVDVDSSGVIVLRHRLRMAGKHAKRRSSANIPKPYPVGTFL
jgi:hypothetical protein